MSMGILSSVYFCMSLDFQSFDSGVYECSGEDEEWSTCKLSKACESSQKVLMKVADHLVTNWATQSKLMCEGVS